MNNPITLKMFIAVMSMIFFPAIGYVMSIEGMREKTYKNEYEIIEIKKELYLTNKTINKNHLEIIRELGVIKVLIEVKNNERNK